MNKINKRNQQPQLLLQAVKAGKTDYKNDLDQATMAQLRLALLEDQGYVCCYCQKRIPEKLLPKSKIEHFKCRHSFPDRQLEFQNLFIACNGIGNKEEKTCDTKKGRKAINSFDFMTTKFEDEITYSKIGTISAKNQDIDNEINDVLNLNDDNLIEARKQVLTIINFLKRKIGQSAGSYQNKLDKLIDDWTSKDANGKFKPYFTAGVYYLKK